MPSFDIISEVNAQEVKNAVGALEKISGDRVKRPVTVKTGVAQDKAKQIQKLIKDSKIKVAASIIGQKVDHRLAHPVY